jgi:hypothetical protein
MSSVTEPRRSFGWADMEIDEEDFAPIRGNANVRKLLWKSFGDQTYDHTWEKFDPKQAQWDLAAPLMAIREEDEADDSEDEDMEACCATDDDQIRAACHSEGESTDTPSDQELSSQEGHHSRVADEKEGWTLIKRQGRHKSRFPKH